MATSSLERDIVRVVDLINNRARTNERIIIGISGPPASGKSTLAESVVQALNQRSTGSVPRAALLPMDGYHLDNQILESRGLLARKGAPETFNAVGFCDAVQALADPNREGFFPRFDRQMDLAIANAIVVQSDTQIVVVEGNYLLLTSSPWASLQDVFAATVFVAPAMQDLRDRLVQRWIQHGLNRDAAVHRAESNDLPNAKLIIDQSRSADLVLTQNYTEFGVRYAY